MLPPHDDANLHGLVPLLRKQFAVDRHRMIQIWAGLAELSCCELGVFTHEIAETKATWPGLRGLTAQALVEGVSNDYP